MKKVNLLKIVIIISVLFARPNSVLGQFVPIFEEYDKVVAPPSVRDINDRFGDEKAVSIRGNHAVVGAPGAGTNGQVFIYKKIAPNCNWEYIQTLDAISTFPGLTNSRFGSSVAMSDEFIVVGAENDDFDENNANLLNDAGAAYIYQFNGSSWDYVDKITPISSERQTDAHFGNDVDIFITNVIVGAPQENNAQGAAYVFETANQVNWIQQNRLTASDGDSEDLFGCSVAIDDNWAIVGAQLDEHGALINPGPNYSEAGSAYIYQNIGTWAQTQKIVDPIRSDFDEFGNDVDIDGTTLIIGAFRDSELAAGNSQTQGCLNFTGALFGNGSAFIYELNLSGIWVLDKHLDRNTSPTCGQQFGSAVAISGDHIVVGEFWSFYHFFPLGSGAAVRAGAVHHYFHYLNALWIPRPVILNSDVGTGSNYGSGYSGKNVLFGSSVAIHNEQFIAGAPGQTQDDNSPPGNIMNNAGSAYIFEFDSIPADAPVLASTSSIACLATSGQVNLSITSGNLNEASHWAWSLSCGGPIIDTGISITVTQNAAVTSTYYAWGVSCEGNGPCGSTTVSFNPTTSWNQTTKDAAEVDITNDVVTDSDGNVYVTGTFALETTLDGGNNPDITMSTGNNHESAYIAKYDPCGNLLWESHTENYDNNYGEGITLHEIENVVYITGSTIFGLGFTAPSCGGIVSPKLSPGERKGYIAAFEMNSGCIISLDLVHQLSAFHSIYPPNSNLTSCYNIEVDQATGDVFVSGRSADRPISLGIQPHDYIPFIHEYNHGTLGLQPSNYTWATPSSIVVASNRSVINDIDYDQQRQTLWVTGSYIWRLSWQMGGITGALISHPHSSTFASSDAYISSFSTNGGLNLAQMKVGGMLHNNPLVNTTTHGGTIMEGNGITVDEGTGKVFLTGTYGGAINAHTTASFFDGFSLGVNFPVNLVSANSKSAYFICYDPLMGNHWGKFSNNTAGFARGQKVAVKNGNVSFVGDFYQNISFANHISNSMINGGGNISWSSFASIPYVGNGITGGLHVYITSFDLHGNFMWLNSTTDPSGSSLDQRVEAITYDDNDHVFVVGSYFNEMDYMNGSTVPLASTPFGGPTNGYILRSNVTNSGAIYRKIAPISATQEGKDQLLVSPNPTAGKVYIRAIGSEASTINIKVMGISGNVILEKKMLLNSNNELGIDLSGYSDGLYIISTTINSKPFYQKVMKH